MKINKDNDDWWRLLDKFCFETWGNFYFESILIVSLLCHMKVYVCECELWSFLCHIKNTLVTANVDLMWYKTFNNFQDIYCNVNVRRTVLLSYNKYWLQSNFLLDSFVSNINMSPFLSQSFHLHLSHSCGGFEVANSGSNY